jgi:hypothetical protein
MPLYYLNTQLQKKEFFTDVGTIREALLMAESLELVRLKSYYGQQDLKRRYKTINKGVASPELKLMMDWMPADMILRRLYEHQLHTSSFTLEFDSGILIVGTPNREIIVTFPTEDRMYSVFDAFAVSSFIRGPLLNNPGVLYQVNGRSERMTSEGYFKSIWEWIDQKDFESAVKNVPVNLN